MPSFPVTEAQIVALFMECIVYGIYLVTLWITARALFFDALGERKKVNWPMVAVMSLMAVFATLDVALGLKHNLDAFIFYTGPGGPQEEFENISYWVNVMKVRLFFGRSLCAVVNGMHVVCRRWIRRLWLSLEMRCWYVPSLTLSIF